MTPINHRFAPLGWEHAWTDQLEHLHDLVSEKDEWLGGESSPNRAALACKMVLDGEVYRAR